MLLRNNMVVKFVKYSAVGFICTLIYFLSMFVLVEGLNRDPVYGAAISFIIMTVFSFILNRKYTFGGDYSHQQFIRFIIVSSIGFVLNYAIMHLIVNVLSYDYLFGEFVTILVIPLVNFTLNYFWTFSQ